MARENRRTTSWPCVLSGWHKQPFRVRRPVRQAIWRAGSPTKKGWMWFHENRQQPRRWICRRRQAPVQQRIGLPPPSAREDCLVADQKRNTYFAKVSAGSIRRHWLGHRSIGHFRCREPQPQSRRTATQWLRKPVNVRERVAKKRKILQRRGKQISFTGAADIH